MKKKAGFKEVLKVLGLSEGDFETISEMVEKKYFNEDVVVIHLEDPEIEQEMMSLPPGYGAFAVSTMSKEEALSKPISNGDDGLSSRIHDVLSCGKRAIIWSRKKVQVVQGVPKYEFELEGIPLDSNDLKKDLGT